ncbi:penicillin-binding protein 1B [Simiduia aestuariiviva]|uniref:Penicillin-binding protein 1B n=1 Tax=Simiduia aestuariiviva TaxID=1510459 RepID=A0A839UUS0_9GAMM|nr:penicillin-binding protein 1B [Simiduia aestuariiviva]MBB3170190.1 penicillin-binding protein 1B [Simiduia aestuariiviva]
MAKRTSARKSRSSSACRSGRLTWRAWLVRLLLLASALGLVALVLIDWQLRAKFDGKKWALPARVYAQPLELYEGSRMAPARLESHLKRLGYQPVVKISGSGQFSREAFGGAINYHIATRGFQFWDGLSPATRWQLQLRNGVVSSLSADQAGADFLRLEPEQIGGIYPAHLEDRQLVRLADIPPLLGETLLAVEDRHFLEHHGVSLRAVARAFMANLRAGGVTQGGSTLTQQLVKNFYLTSERSLSRKGLEAVMALLLEIHYSKAEILETYLNEVYLGQQGAKSIHGFALASQHYFRRPLNELAPDQIALLVGLVKGASYYNPWRSPKRAKARRDLVLGVMREAQLITAEQHRDYLSRPLRIAAQNSEPVTRYANFIDLVKRQLTRDYKPADLQSEGLNIFTTLDLQVQSHVETTLQQQLVGTEAGYQLPKESLQGAAVVVRVGTAEVLALAGDRNPSVAGFNRALDAHRQIGSLAKPAIYLTALMQPARYQLSTLISDEPVRVAGPDGDWVPQNYQRESHGQVPLFEALAKSYNQASARLGMQLGLRQVADTLTQLGAERDVPQVPAMLLGAVGMSPMEVAERYHTLAADGFYSPLRAIKSVTTKDGLPLQRYPLAVEARLPAEAVYQLQYGLRAVMREGTGKGAYRYLPDTLDVAGKTGTTNDQRDSWFAGFSGEHLAVAWVGRDDNGTTPLTGATGALPIWARVMAGIETRGLDAPAPSGIHLYWVDGATGRASGENCEGARLLPFTDGYTPQDRVPCRYLEHPLKHWWKSLWQ